MRLSLFTLCALALFAGGVLAADHPPVGAVVVAKDNGKSYLHLGNGNFKEVAATLPQSMPACTTCGPACPCPAGVCADGKCPIQGTAQAGNDALAAVNAKRAARGLRPYQFDAALTAAAQACASHRANARMFGHTANDFHFLPAGARAEATGCAAYPLSYGFMACAIYDNYTYAGAAMVPGPDGKIYCHLFVSNSPNSGAGSPLGHIAPNPAPLPAGFAPQSYTLPQSGGCANGSCGVPQSQPGGFFRR